MSKRKRKRNSRGVTGWGFGEFDMSFNGVVGWGFGELAMSFNGVVGWGFGELDMPFNGVVGWGFGELAVISDECWEVFIGVLFSFSDFFKKRI